MRSGADDGAGALLRIGRLAEIDRIRHEDSGADKYGFSPKLAHKGGIGRSSYASSREIWHWQFACLRHQTHDLIRGLELLCPGIEFIIAEHGEQAHVTGNSTQVLDCMDHVTGSGFSLGADHGRAFSDPPQCLAQIASAADKR